MTAPSRAVLPPLAYSDRLVALVGRSEAAAARLAGAAPERLRQLAPAARRESARLSARLDGSPLEDATAAEVDAREDAGEPPAGSAAGPAPPPGAPARGGWERALKLEGMPTQEVAALEYANLLACYDAEPDLAPGLLSAPGETLAAVHRLLCRGLVADGVAGRLRQSEQAVHDGAAGQMIYRAPPPPRLPDLMGALDRWLREDSVRYVPLVVAGVVHERLLEWQPFEAANGRLARAASRLVLRARGTDVHGLAVPERWLAEDALGYYREVAATMRRRGALAPWLERFGEALCPALEGVAAAAGLLPPGEPGRPAGQA